MANGGRKVVAPGRAWLVQLFEDRLGPRLVGGVELPARVDPAQVMPRLAQAVVGALPPEDDPPDLVVLSGVLLAQVQATTAPLTPAGR